MKCYIALVLLLILTVECSPQSGFFISAPSVFHIGVGEKVFIQMQEEHLLRPVTLYLEHESTGVVVSNRENTQSNLEKIKTVELKIDNEILSRIIPPPKYLTLVADSSTFRPNRQKTRVLISRHRGYIFIQTDQPMYNPTQKVNYRIFILDHLLRPNMEAIQISVYNAAGNRVMQTRRTAPGGIYRSSFFIPSVSKMGTWKITAHYAGDEANVASREFKVQRFVLPTFDVDIAMEENYINLKAQQLMFTISAMYTYGEKVQGAYHCQFGVVNKGKISDQKWPPLFIKGLELTGSVQDGTASVSLQTSELNLKLQNHQNKTLFDLQKSGQQIYLRVFVTNIQNGEVQETEVYLPVISQKYSTDLSQTRSHFVPGYPLDVVVFMRLPDGTPAVGLPVEIDVRPSTGERWQTITNQEGAVFHTFNLQDVPEITVVVSSDGLEETKKISRASSPSNSYLYMTFTPMMYSVGDLLTITFNTINAPERGIIYYMVLSRGMLIQSGSVELGRSTKKILRITADMVPSFRLIAYYHNGRGDIIADSVWVDVRDECKIKVTVEQKGQLKPGRPSLLEFDLQDQTAKVALLAVDKAFYALNADNKLTPKELFSTMASYDLGCTKSAGADSTSVLLNAGLSFMSNSMAKHKMEAGCESVRQKRSVDLKQELETLKSNFLDTDLKECCVQGFAEIPMSRTCQERANRVVLVKKNQTCADAFLNCCIEAERLRQKKMQEDREKGFGRTATIAEIEEMIVEATSGNIRRIFPPSFAFTEFEVKRKGSYSLTLPDSITTWEIQVITLSPDTGFCVVKPSELKAFKDTFVSLTLPYSVRKYEHLSVSPVIYNYGATKLQLAVHMEQAEGLCSPGSATSTSFVNITLENKTSQFVSFSAVPMVTGSIPIKIHLFDIENGWGIDGIEKKLNVQTEGLEQTIEETKVLKLDGKSTHNLIIDGTLPDDTVPDSTSNIFISVEGNGFGNSYAKNLLSPETVAKLIVLPTGCLEQTMSKLAPTALALRYLDLSDQWFSLPPGSRDEALDNIEKGYVNILTYKKSNGAYGAWNSVPSSNWVTALVVKVLSLVAQRQTVTFGQQGRAAKVVPEDEITQPVTYLLSVQNNDGSFTDPHPVLHRKVLKGKDQEAAMTAFITLALHRSREFMKTEVKNDVEAKISRSTTYLQSTLDKLQHPYAVALTAYCLALCLPKGTNHSATWTKLQELVTKSKDGCYLWTTDPSPQNQKVANGITVETTAYALLAAVELGQSEWADKTACWLTTQENYFRGYKSSQDTIMALEALSEYELKRPARPDVNIIAEFTAPGKREVENLALENSKEKAETDLKKLVGNNIHVKLTGKGEAKLKIQKAYHILEPKDKCTELSISVTVEGKVKYTAKVIENYDYYDYDNNEEKGAQEPQPETDGPDAHTRNRRAADNDVNSREVVTYTVCVSVNSSLTGMAIADITLLSGFVAVTDDLEKLKLPPEQYISHYEVSYGRVLIYFNELLQQQECISFTAEQRVPVGLLQPAPAVFYDYYEPSRRCTVFYSAPQRSKMVSTLCSEDVCQCAERPCHKLQETFKQTSKGRRLSKEDRERHACFFPTVDYAYIVEVLGVSVKSNFELFRTKVIKVFKSNGDVPVTRNSVRVFAKRLQCKVKLDLGTQYLIMGKDGTTTDSAGEMQYLLESNTWVEKHPSPQDCSKSAHRATCRGFDAFVAGYELNGCRQ